MSTISTHVLDSATGRPAAGMAIALETAVVIEPADGRGWIGLGRGVTDADGRLKDWGQTPARPSTAPPSIGPGRYRLIFDTGAWFAERDRECFYPEVVITFTVDDDGAHFHVPLLLAAFAYSTYRGS
jgi:5-hydroxyisourate hydrolase